MDERVGRSLGHLATGVADQEGDGLMGVVGVSAGEKGIAGGEPMDTPGLDQKVERPVDRDRRRAAACLGAQQVDQLVGPDWSYRAREKVEDALPPRCHAAGLDRVPVRMTLRMVVLVCFAHAANIGGPAPETKVVFWPGLA